jgi:hypothetical protein
MVSAIPSALLVAGTTAAIVIRKRALAARQLELDDAVGVAAGGVFDWASDPELAAAAGQDGVSGQRHGDRG